MTGNYKRQLLKAKIRPSSILYTYCNFIHNPHNKYLVIVHIDSEYRDLLVFLINSEVNQIIVNNPILNSCQVLLKSSIYKFLDHDSYVDCSQVFDELDIEMILDHLLENDDDFKGYLLDDELLQVIEAVQATPTISSLDKDLIISVLGE